MLNIGDVFFKFVIIFYSVFYHDFYERDGECSLRRQLSPDEISDLYIYTSKLLFS